MKVIKVAFAFVAATLLLASCASQQKMGCPGAITSVEVQSSQNS